MNYLKFLVFAFLFAYFLATSSFAATIEEIVIKDNLRVDTDYIELMISSKIGQQYDLELVDEDLKKLYATELFRNITVQFNRGILTFIIQENPLMDEVIIEGNSNLDDATITRELISQPRSNFSERRVKLDHKRILSIYHKNGYLSANVSYEVIEKDFNRVDVIFQVDEGKKTLIGEIIFLGNENYSKSDLEDIILSKEDKFWRIINPTAVYDKSRIDYDGELLRQFYLENGYPDFMLISTFSEFSPRGNNIVVSYTIAEGERYRFGDVSYVINITQLEQFRELIETSILLDKTEWFKLSTLQKQIGALKDVLGNLGYQFLSITPRMQYNQFTHTADVVIVISPAPRVFVSSIDIVGNTKTRDNVIRRELSVLEGDAFDREKLNQSIRNLYRLQYFELVEVDTTTSANGDEMNIDVEVTEMSTASINGGLGYSTLDKWTFELSFVESNLFGTGRFLGLSTYISSNTKSYSLNLAEPYFLGSNISANTSIFRRETNSISSVTNSVLYRRDDTGGSFGISYLLSDNIKQSLSLSITRRNVYDVASSSSTLIRQIEGDNLLTTFYHTLSYDGRDNALYPKSGITASLNTSYTGLFSDISLIKNSIGTTWYYEFYEDLVLASSASIAAAHSLDDQDVLLVDRYNLGGSTLRGFLSSAVGPRDLISGEFLGGAYMARGSFQLQYPIPAVKNYGLLFHVFSDFGTLTSFEKGPYLIDDKKIRLSAGVGISWRSPIGLIGIDYGYPILIGDYDIEERIFFNFGAGF